MHRQFLRTGVHPVIEIALPWMMVQCDLLSGDQVSRPYVGLGHLLAGSIGFIILMVGPDQRPIIVGPQADWGFSRTKNRLLEVA